MRPNAEDVKYLTRSTLYLELMLKRIQCFFAFTNDLYLTRDITSSCSLWTGFAGFEVTA
jgi:hypothetical protein